MSKRTGNWMGKRFAAVDYDSRRLRIVEAERVGKNLRVGRMCDLPLPEGVDASDARSMGALLGDVLRQAKLRKLPLLMTVNRGEAVFKPISLPPGTPEDERAGMVQFQMQGELPYRPEEAVVDFTVDSHFAGAVPTPEEEADGLEVLVAAVKVPVVDHYRQIANAAGTRLLRLGLRPYANHHCVETCIDEDGERAVALVHLTADETEIDVIASGGLRLSRAAAAKIPDAGEADEEATRRGVSAIATEVARSLRSYTAVEGTQSIGRILVAGGTGLEQRLAETLEQRMRLPVEKLDPSRAFRLREVSDGADPSAFITALGLAMGNCLRDLPFDFLNPKRPVVKHDTRRTKILAVAAVAVVAVAAGIIGRGYLMQPRQRRIAELRNQLRRQKQVAQALKDERAYLERVRGWIDARDAYLSRFAELAAVMPAATHVYVRQFRSLDGGFSFRAHLTTDAVIRDFRERLERAGYEVEISNRTRDDDSTYAYVAEVKVLFPKTAPPAPAELEPEPRPSDDISARKGYQS